MGLGASTLVRLVLKSYEGEGAGDGTGAGEGAECSAPEARLRPLVLKSYGGEELSMLKSYESEGAGEGAGAGEGPECSAPEARLAPLVLKSYEDDEGSPSECRDTPSGRVTLDASSPLLARVLKSYMASRFSCIAHAFCSSPRFRGEFIRILAALSYAKGSASPCCWRNRSIVSS